MMQDVITIVWPLVYIKKHGRMQKHFLFKAQSILHFLHVCEGQRTVWTMQIAS